MAGAARPAQPGPRPWNATRGLEVVVALGGAAGLIGGLLYYFGWARSSALFGWFGVDVGVLELSFQDYLLRSVGSAFWPLTTAGVVALLAFAVHRPLVLARRRVMIGRVLAVGGGLLLVTGLAAVARLITFLVDWPVVPTGLLAGTLLVVYGLRLAADQPVPGRPAAGPTSGWQLPVALLLVVLTFWSAAGHASYRGRNRADDIAENLYRSPGVLVFSTADLRLHGTGVDARHVGPPDADLGWCYGGLRLLIRSGDRHFLLPEQWVRGRDPVLVVSESSDVRVEYLATRLPTACP